MVLKTANRAALVGMFLALLSFGAGAAQATPWKQVQTDTGTQYRIGNEIRNSFVIHCGRSSAKAGTWIGMTIHGEPPPKMETIQVIVGKQAFALEVDSNGRVSTVSNPDTAALDRFWDAMRNNKAMTVRYPDGLNGTFTLRGTSTTLPPRACRTGFNRL